MVNKEIQLLERAKILRSNQTIAEDRLWYYIRAHRFMGMKFKRQIPFGSYIVDFYCHAYKLVIEVDGGQHQDNVDYDRRRDSWLKEQGFMVLRFWNNDVILRTESVLESIRHSVGQNME